jgi:hypothetical protein
VLFTPTTDLIWCVWWAAEERRERDDMHPSCYRCIVAMHHNAHAEARPPSRSCAHFCVHHTSRLWRGLFGATTKLNRLEGKRGTPQVRSVHVAKKHSLKRDV